MLKWRRLSEWVRGLEPAVRLAALFFPAAVIGGFLLDFGLGDGSWRERLLAYGGAAEFFGLLGIVRAMSVRLPSKTAPKSMWIRSATRSAIPIGQA